MKVAILGAGLSGLACAIECERLGVQAEIFERGTSVGWIYPSVNFWPNIFYNHIGDVRNHIKKEYRIDFTSLNDTDTLVMKSARKQTVVKGTLGLSIIRGKADKSLENQLLLQINKTPIHYNYLGHYDELAKQYDYVVVATGREIEARDMGVWQDEDAVTTIGGTALGSFDINSSTIYFNTEYAGTGYGRVTPMNQQCATIGLYIFGRPEIQALELFQKFIQMEELDKLEYLFRYIPPVFITGKVTEFQKDNVILTGAAAGLVDRVLGVGAVEAMVSGTLAARAIAWKEDYTSMVKPLQTHIESISAFRKSLNKFDNDDFDKVISVLGMPGIKQAVYNTSVNFVGMAGSILKTLNKS